MRIDQPGPVARRTRLRVGAAAEGDEGGAKKVIVRSNGVMPVGKDIANQFWKLGLLGATLPASSASRRRRSGRASGPEPGAPRQPCQAHLQRHRLEADVLQALLSQALKPSACGGGRQLHSFFVRDGALARRARARLSGASWDAAESPSSVSGRKGLGVKIDDLLDC